MGLPKTEKLALFQFFLPLNRGQRVKGEGGGIHIFCECWVCKTARPFSQQDMTIQQTAFQKHWPTNSKGGFCNISGTNMPTWEFGNPLKNDFSCFQQLDACKNMQRISKFEDEQLGRRDCSAKCQNFPATEKNHQRIAPKLANEKEEASGESDNEWARMRRSPERSHSQGTTHATSFTANYCLSLQRAAQNTNSNTITTASANQITNTNVHCENKWYNCRPLASQPKEDLKGKTRILFTSPYQAHTSYLSILVHHHIYLSSVKVHQKAGKKANIGRKEPKSCVLYAQKYTCLEKVHHRRCCRCWLMWAMMVEQWRANISSHCKASSWWLVRCALSKNLFWIDELKRMFFTWRLPLVD